MQTDRYGLSLTTASDAAAAAYRAGVDCVLAAWPGAAGQFETAIAADPDFALAHIARGRVLQIYAETADARAAAGRARELAMRASERERRHVEVIASAIEGQPGRALTLAEEQLAAYPRDALVLALLLGAFGLYAFSGRADHDAARVAICERLAPHYGRDWWFLTYLGWAHTEAGNVGPGRALTEDALRLRRQNANAAHALAHALFEQGDSEAAAGFVRQWLPEYGRDGILHGHIAWHLALLALERDDTAEALRLFEEWIGPTVSRAPPLNVFTDSASLLWRLGLAGADGLTSHWQAAADYATRSFPRAGVTFGDVHMGLFAGAGPAQSLAEDRLHAIEALAAQGKVAAGPVVPALLRGFRAFADADFTEAARLLETALPEAVRIGGSHAQRELIEDTLIVAELKSGAKAKARARLDARLHRRPSARDARWRTMAT